MPLATADIDTLEITYREFSTLALDSLYYYSLNSLDYMLVIDGVSQKIFLTNIYHIQRTGRKSFILKIKFVLKK